MLACLACLFVFGLACTSWSTCLLACLRIGERSCNEEMHGTSRKRRATTPSKKNISKRYDFQALQLGRSSPACYGHVRSF